MSDKSAIEWTDATWPIVQGCDPVSQGCVFCYAVPLLWRMAHNPNEKISAPLQGLVEQHTNAAGETILRFTGKLALREDRLDWPLKWKTPRMIFVPSHGDIFHKDVPDEFLDKIFAVMALCPQHTFQVLTKRAKRMRDYMSDVLRRNSIELAAEAWPSSGHPWSPKHCFRWPLPNVWLGVSAEDQDNFDQRVADLYNTPAAIRFFSFEPLLGSIDARGPLSTGAFHWAIVGGESGKGARRMHERWAIELRDQCAGAQVPFFFKQWGSHDPETFDRVGKKAAGRLLDGVTHDEFPRGPSCS